MKHLLILLSLPILIACGGLTGSGPATDTPPAQIPGTTDSVSPTIIPSSTDTAAAPQNVTSFPNTNNYIWWIVSNDLDFPVDIQPTKSELGRMYIVEKQGTIHAFTNNQIDKEPFLNIEDRINQGFSEKGLLGLAFHPNYEQNGYFYVNYTGSGGDTHISRFQAVNGKGDPNSEVVLMVIKQPYPNHNGGGLAFGPDGYLYIGLGDGGLVGDPYKNAQNTSVMLGKILRIDVDNGNPYAIPPGNPFGNEVWAFGLRNPWRFSFDNANGDLYIGDVGQGKWEEVDYLPAGTSGANFGWSVVEGNHPYDGEAQASFTPPIAEYSHDLGCAVTGGYVYRGALPGLNGIYMYADYCRGTIWGALQVDGQWQSQIMFETGENITSFGQDEFGEMYITTESGNVLKLIRK